MHHQVDLRNKQWIGITGDRCGSGIEWVPFEINNDSSSSGDGDRQNAFKSWRTREGMDPIAAGPHWPEVKKKLESSGVDVWWDPRPDYQQAAPEARVAPQVDIVLESEKVSATESEASSTADLGKGGGHGGEGGEEEDMAVGDGRVDGRVAFEAGRGGNGGGHGVAGVGGGGGESVEVEVPRREEEEEGSRVGFFGGLLAIVGIAAVYVAGRRRSSRRRKRRAHGRRKVAEWTGTAFSTGAISPLGVKKFAWHTERSKVHEHDV